MSPTLRPRKKEKKARARKKTKSAHRSVSLPYTVRALHAGDHATALGSAVTRLECWVDSALPHARRRVPSGPSGSSRRSAATRAAAVDAAALSGAVTRPKRWIASRATRRSSRFVRELSNAEAAHAAAVGFTNRVASSRRRGRTKAPPRNIDRSLLHDPWTAESERRGTATAPPGILRGAPRSANRSRRQIATFSIGLGISFVIRLALAYAVDALRVKAAYQSSHGSSGSHWVSGSPV